MKQYITGLQHIAIPTKDFARTLDFYAGLGFDNIFQCKNGEDDVAFLKIGDMVIETYTFPAVGTTGCIDHIALDVTDVDATYAAAKEAGYKVVNELENLPFFENGVRFFKIEGPNGEVLEFSQML